MATNFEYAAQQMLYTALNGNISATVYDAVPELPVNTPTANFPYVTIGEADALPFDNDSDLGQYVICTLHVWSKAEGQAQVKSILGEIYGILHRGTMSLSGYSLLDSLYMSSSADLASDGETRHGVARYQLTIQEAS